ncbi:MAG: NAD(P)/FAD-dependent oxidoreductase [Candidatus Promineifilaceae bacterium]
MSSLKKYDVIVLGGGLAGLTLALQLKQTRPNTTILVVERNEHPLPEESLKVGESTLEGASLYFADVLGMKEHLDQKHFFKAGLRFFTPYADNSEIERRPEIGTVRTFEEDKTVVSYQIQRERFENELGEKIRTLGVTFWDGARVTDIVLDEADEVHTITVDYDDEPHQLEARWVVDASGRAALLRRRLKLNKKLKHPVNAAWFRVSQRLNTNLWSRSRDWRTRIDSSDVRIFATTHLCGEGYWVWIIPIAPADTSIGIVADESLHSLREINTFDRALNWLEEHEPQCAEAINPDALVDFRAMRHFTNGCKQHFSSQRWGITGVAGAFADPLYSPGSEFIATGNTILTDLIPRSLAGEDITERTAFYNWFLLDFFFNISISEYLGQYKHLGKPLVITLKEIWHAAWYWGVIGLIVAHPEQMCNMELMAEIKPHLMRFSNVQRQVQELFRNWPLDDPKHNDVMVDYLNIRAVFALHVAMVEPLTDEQFVERIAENVTLLEMLTAELYAYVQPDVMPELELTHPAKEAMPDLAFDLKHHVFDLIGKERVTGIEQLAVAGD